MTVQSRLDIDTTPFIVASLPAQREDRATLKQDAARVTPLAPYTLMAKVAATQKWVPFTSVTATDGSAIPQGIFLGSQIAAADLVAGDVIDQPILTMGAQFDEDKLVIENSKTLETVFSGNAAGTGSATPYLLLTVRDLLALRQLIPVKTRNTGRVENL